MKRQKENSHENITWSEMGKQNVQAEKVYSFKISDIRPAGHVQTDNFCRGIRFPEKENEMQHV